MPVRCPYQFLTVSHQRFLPLRNEARRPTQPRAATLPPSPMNQWAVVDKACFSRRGNERAGTATNHVEQMPRCLIRGARHHHQQRALSVFVTVNRSSVGRRAAALLEAALGCGCRKRGRIWKRHKALSSASRWCGQLRMRQAQFWIRSVQSCWRRCCVTVGIVVMTVEICRGKNRVGHQVGSVSSFCAQNGLTWLCVHSCSGMQHIALA
jgi:hypothetical protein